MIRRALLLAGSAILVLSTLGCPRSASTVKQMWMPMGTFATVTVPERDRGALPGYVAQTQDIFQDIENAMSLYNPTSELSRLNAVAGQGGMELSDLTADMLALTLDYCRLTEGRFDPTVGPLVKLWGFSGGKTPETAPSPDVLASTLTEAVGYRHIALSNKVATLARPGMVLDLGGIAKGYAIDLCFDRLRGQGVTDIMLNLGGNIRCGGVVNSGKPWTIGVRDPLETGRTIGTIALPDGMAIATSGNYERFVTIAGQRYAHIIDPTTGLPVQGMAGVTAVSTSAVEADAMSTALFVMGAERAKALLESRPSCHALFVKDARPLRVYVSKGMAPLFVPRKGVVVEPL